MNKFLNELKIFNLWGKKEVKINFFDDVTFLTGLNGSGKSTILNILFDTLNPHESLISSTSKNRFWGATATFSDKSEISKACFPSSDTMMEMATDIDNYIGDDSLFSYDSIIKIKTIYEDKFENISNKYSLYNSKDQGVLSINSYAAEVNEYQPFIYQDDKKCLHNIKESNIDFNSDYWGQYGNQLDERFYYIRDSLQIYESKINKLFSDAILKMKANPKKQDFIKLISNHQSGIQSIADLIGLLNEYFKPVGKEIAKDESDKIELRFIEGKDTIKWYDLSRGEKTIIYLILTAFLYKDKVKVFIFDEPDISIHMEWQDRLINDLVKLAPKCQFVIATHSPALIMNGWLDRTITIEI